MKCPKCGSEMKPNAYWTLKFQQGEYWTCPNNCGHSEKVKE